MTGAKPWSFRPVVLPLARPYRWAGGAQTERHILIARLEAGATGWGETAPPPHEAVDLAVFQAQAETAVARLGNGAAFLGALDGRAVPARVRAGLATAWLDVRARQAGVPLCAILAERAGGRSRAAVRVNALVTAEDAATAAAQARDAVARGHDTIKVKCTADRGADLARVAAVREAAPRVALRLDANGSWDPAWAEEHLSRLAAHGIAYVEDPLPSGTPLADFAELGDRAGVPVALDEAIDGPSAVQAAHDAGIRHVILKPQRLGGPDHAVLCGMFAARLGMTPVVTNSLESAVGLTAALHVAAVLPDVACGLGTAGLFARDVAPSPHLAGGVMRVPSAPGLGLEVA